MVELCNGVKNCVEEYSFVEGSLHQKEPLPVMLTTSCLMKIMFGWIIDILFFTTYY